MRLSRYLLATITLAIVLTGCTRASQAPSPAEVTPPAAAKETPSPAETPPLPKPDDLRREALALMEAGDYPGAAAKWKLVVEREPSADNWNELSFAYLQARQWSAAAEAGKEALKIERDHPFALYNTGIAVLEGGSPCKAESYLAQSAYLQPDRYEPLVGLARSYIAQRNYALALDAATRAAALGGQRAEVTAVVATAKALRTPPPPPDLATASTVIQKEADFTLYLYREAPGCDNYNTTLYAVRNDGTVHSLQVGPVGLDKSKATIQGLQLPGRVRGYWLVDYEDTLAYVSHAKAWHLFTYDGSQFAEVVFEGEWPEPSNFVPSMGAPTVNGQEVEAVSFDGASGTRLHAYVWTLAPDLRTAKLTETVTEMEAEIVTLQGSSIEVIPVDALGVPREQYKQTLKLSPVLQITRNDQPASLTDLQPDMLVHLTLNPWDTITRLSISP